MKNIRQLVEQFPIVISDEPLPVIGYEPIGDKVLLRFPKDDPNAMKDDRGILVPVEQSRANNPIREREVSAAGPECKQVKAGDFVLFNILNYQPFTIDGEDLFFVPESNLISVVRRAVVAPVSTD